VVAEPAVQPAKPARVMVADAEGDPAAYKKLLGNLFSNGAPATPATDAATVPAVAAVEPEPAAAKPNIAAKPAAKHAPAKTVHAAAAPANTGKADEEKAGRPVQKAASAAAASPKTTGSTTPKN
jgi:hypothetical protein